MRAFGAEYFGTIEKIRRCGNLELTGGIEIAEPE